MNSDSEHWAAHKWCGIILGEVAEIDGTQKLLEASPRIKEHFEKSISLHQDPTTIHCLGIWHFKFTELSWYKRQAASLYFGVTVPTSTYEIALDYFTLAETTEPEFYSHNQLMIGLCYLRLGDKERAIQFFENVKNWKKDIDEPTYTESVALLNQLKK